MTSHMISTLPAGFTASDIVVIPHCSDHDVYGHCEDRFYLPSAPGVVREWPDETRCQVACESDLFIDGSYWEYWGEESGWTFEASK